MIRLVATDLDGTLLRSDGTVSAYTLGVLAEARRRGVEIVAVTARSPLGLEPIAEVTGLSGRAIASNGSILYDLDTREILSAATVPPEVVRKAVEAAADAVPDAGFAVMTGKALFAEAHYGAITLLYHSRTIVDSREALWGTDRVVRIYMHSASHDTDAMYERVRGLDGLGVAWTHAGGTSMLEIGPDDVSKAAGLRDHCASLGIAPHEVAAFGDMPSDLPMLAWAGHPYAVANAHPAVLAAVPTRAPANDEDGVARTVEALLNPR